MRLRLFVAVAAILLVGASLWMARVQHHVAPNPTQKPDIVARSETPQPTPALGQARAPEEQSSPASHAQTSAEFDWAAITNFNGWVDRWLDGTAGHAEGVRLAEARRPEFKKLIQADPERALEQAVPPVVRQQLPAEVVTLLEKPVSARGDFKVYLGRPAPGVEIDGSELVRRYFDTAAGDSYIAHVFGNVEAVMSRKDVPVRGVAVDRHLALADSAVRQLDVGEIIPAGATVEETCPVSGNSSRVEAPVEVPITDDTPAIELEGKIIRLCDGSHVRVLVDDNRLTANIAASGGPGGAHPIRDNFPGTTSEAIGNFRALYIRACYPDRLNAPNTEESAYNDMKNFSRYYMESSYGKLSVSTVVTPLVVLPHSREWYEAKDETEIDGLGLVHSHSRSEARRLGYDSGQFNVTIVRINGGPRLNGISWGGGDSVWLSWDGMDVINHECGHSIGRPHANFWNTTNQSAIGPGANQEYGNSFDVMGGGGGFSAHYNTIAKRALTWLPVQNTHNPTHGGVYRVFAYDQPVLEEGKRYALRVPKDTVRGYNLEYHPAYGVEHPNQRELTNSALVIWSGFGGGGHLIDTTPRSLGGKDDGGIELGRTFSDSAAAVHFTVLARNATTPPSLDIAVVMGNEDTNLPPTLTLSANATSVPVSGSLTFTATASDPNGDALSYHWDFGDAFASENTPVLTRSFNTTRLHTVHCTVSDLKGGTTRRHMVVNVGSSPRRTITGQVTVAGQPLPDVLITGGGRHAYTDADGNYALPDLTSGAITLTIAHYGYTFNPPAPSVSGTVQDFAAAAMPQISLVAISDAAESGTAGAFALSRTGDTSAALNVRVMSASGTAGRTSDYNLVPGYVDDGNYRTFTIPAGSATLEIAVEPIDDGASEGPETVVLQLAEGMGYIPTSAGLATVTIGDDDTTLPQISIAAVDREASEAPGDITTFVLTREGSTAENVELALAYGGTATRGVDYPTLPLNVTIPAGESSATVIVGGLNDDLVEGSETLTINLVSGAGYVLDTSRTSVDFLLLDDDISTVTLTAIDPTASEADRDPGAFLITRSGPTNTALRVFYGISGDALHGTDYVQLPAEITIPAGASSAVVFVTPYDDAHGEGTETVTAQLTVFDGAYMVGAPMSASVMISDNNDVPLITVDASSSTTSEPTDSGQFRFHLNGSRSGTTTVRYTVSGTATPGVDYQALSGTVVLPEPVDGDSEVNVNVTIIDDILKEDVETITVTILPDPDYVVYNGGSATALLRDNDQPIVSVTKRQDVPAESGAESGFYIGRTSAGFGSVTAGDLTVEYVMSGTAQNGVDYALLSGTAIISSGQAGADIVITPLADSIFEGSETVTLTLSSSANYGIGNKEETLLLSDAGTHPNSVGFLATSSTTSEGPHPTDGEYRTIPVTLTPASANTVTVEYVAGSGTSAWADGVDWALVDDTNGIIHLGILTFPPGVTTQYVRVRVVADNLIEGTENAVITLRNSWNARVSGSRTSHTLAILDHINAHSRARVAFLLAQSSVDEGQAQAPMLMIGLDRSLQTLMRVSYSVTGGSASSGSDFTLAAGTLLFNAGQTSKLIPLTVLNDLEVESPETVVVTLSNPAGGELGAITDHTLTIIDNDSGTPAVSISATDPSATEGADPATFTVSRLSGGAAADLVVRYIVSGSATPGDDYAVLPSQVTIPTGQASAAVLLTTVNDSELESAETVALTIIPDSAYALGPDITATAAIRDDETQGLPPTAFSQDLYVPRNQPSPITLSGSDPNGDPLTFQVVVNPTRGTLSGIAPNLTYRPNLNYIGPDSFAFRVTDGATTSAVATVSLTVFNSVLVASNSVWRFNDLGLDLGSSWKDNAYDHSAWSSGGARLGFGDSQTTLLRGQPVITYYFRQSFTPAEGITWTSLTGRAQRDDGLVVYLNGVEVFRANMPAGDPSYSTRANAAISGSDETAWLTFNVSPSLLQPGANVIAAELHQNDGNSSDAGFALELTGAGVPEASSSSTVTIAATDENAIEPSDPATFTVTRLGGSTSADLAVGYSISGSALPGADYVWPSGVAIIPAGESSAIIPITPLNDYEIEPLKTVVLTLAVGNGYQLETNVTASVTLADEDGGRVPPTALPQSASVNVNTPTSINLAGTDPESDPLMFQIVSPPAFGTLAGTPPNVIYTPHLDYTGADSFTFRVNDGGLWSSAATVSILVFDPAVLIAGGSIWRFHDGGIDLGSGWRMEAFNDSAWRSGAARLGFGDGETTPLRGQPVITYYFRRAFDVPANYVVTNAVIRLQRDDGIVVYLNEAEIIRDNMPATAITYSTRASSSVGGGDETAWFEFPISPGLLRPGNNLMAAEVHQIDGTSSDAGFDLELRAEGYLQGVPNPELSIEITGSAQVRLWFPAANGLRFALDASSNLQTWEPLTTNTVSGDIFQHVAPSTDPAARFFRARQVP